MSNLRPGVQILVDQLASNPDEFFGPLGSNPKMLYAKGPQIKFLDFERALRALATGQPGGDETFWFLTDEEKAALRGAYKEASRVRFDANIITALHAQPEESYVTATGAYTQNLARSMQTTKEAVMSSVIGQGYVIHRGQE